MSNIRQVQWNEGAPEKLEPGMVIDLFDCGPCAAEGICLVGSDISAELAEAGRQFCIRWAWLIQPHELNWLEDMASRKTRTQE